MQPKIMSKILVTFFILRILAGVILCFSCLASTIFPISTSKYDPITEEKNTIILEVSNCSFGPIDIITASQKPNTPILMKFKKNPFAKRLP